MMDIDQIKSWIFKWFIENAGVTEEDLASGENENYFEQNWMDSFKFISFVMDVEKKFSINFDNDEFQNRDFSSIAGLAKIINNKIKE